jgi:hypothetical protein
MSPYPTGLRAAHTLRDRGGRWTGFGRGGRFVAMGEPGLPAADVCQSFRRLR